jgi:hypothetical protein
MTNEQIIEPKKLATSMRSVLAVVSGTADVDELAPFLLEGEGAVTRWNSHAFRRFVAQQKLASLEDADRLHGDLLEMKAIARFLPRYPDLKPRLINVATKCAFLARAILEKTSSNEEVISPDV